MSGRKLLLADDSVTVQKVVQLTFAEEGIDVSIAGDGDSAMLNFAEFRPDIVLADVNMPGLSGYEVCERIKRDNDNIPVVLLVGSFEPFDEEEAKRVGADGSMTKPFQSIRQLIDTVSKLLSSDREPVPDMADEEPDLSATIKIPYPETAELGDSGMDDEMIETTRVDDTGETEAVEEPGPPPDEEVRAFENGEETETPAYNGEGTDTSAYNGEEAETPGYGGEEAETPAYNGEETESPAYNFERVTDEPDEEENFLEEGPPESSQPLPAPIMELDDLNFLEIPVAGIPVLPPVVQEEETAPPAEAPVSTEPSPEFIETVVRKVIEKLAGDPLRDVVREVVREMNAEGTGD